MKAPKAAAADAVADRPRAETQTQQLPPRHHPELPPGQVTNRALDLLRRSKLRFWSHGDHKPGVGSGAPVSLGLVT